MTSITIRIEETEKEALQKFAKENDLSVSQAVRRAIKYLLDLDPRIRVITHLKNISVLLHTICIKIN